MRVDTSELHDLTSDLNAGAGEVAQKADRAFRSTVFGIEADGKIGAPVDTGTLQNSISSDIFGQGQWLEAEIGPTAEYGIWQEIGTSVMPGRNYMSRAFDRRIPPFTEAIANLGGQLL